MDRMTLQTKFTAFFKKYRYVALVLLLGLFLMALPSGEKTAIAEEPAATTVAAEPTVQDALEAILSQIQGAGRVHVLLTQAEGEQTIYQTDQDSNTSDASSSIRVETVVITDAGKAQQGLVMQVNPPTYLGAVVVCQGGDNPAVQLAVVEAVASATGLGADRITVLKMK